MQDPQTETKPMVSVCMLTYNHEEFIAEAIEGVAKQKCPFRIELVIGDDCSTDGTSWIIVELANKYPGLIKLLKRPTNLGLSENFRDALNNCTGRYIAICEGDDYWTDPQKVAKQVEFMEANPDYSMHFHNSEMIYMDRSHPSELTTGPTATDYSFQDFLERRLVVGTQSMLFRRDALPILPNHFIVFDWVLFLIISHNGKVRFANEVMSVYRKHDDNWTNNFSLKKAEFFLRMTEQCKAYFAPSYSDRFDKWLAHCKADVCFGAFNEGESLKFREAFSATKKFWTLLGARKKFGLVLRYWLISMPFGPKIYKTFVGLLIAVRRSVSES